MPDGGVLRIVTHNAQPSKWQRIDALDAGDYVRIAVIDTGSGMTRDVLERAFEPFFTTKDIGKGSGLGLAQVYGVAAQFGGTVLLASQPGAGTTVEVFLPRADATRTASRCTNHVPTTCTVAGASSWWWTTTPTFARSPRSCCARRATWSRKRPMVTKRAISLRRGAVSLALVDYAMPMMSGTEFVRLARDIQPDLPVIYVTGAADALEQDRVSDPVIMKPYTRAALLRIVRELALPRA